MMKKNFKLLVLPSVKNMQQVINRFSFPIELTKGKLKNIKIIFKKNTIHSKQKNVYISGNLDRDNVPLYKHISPKKRDRKKKRMGGKEKIGGNKT